MAKVRKCTSPKPGKVSYQSREYKNRCLCEPGNVLFAPSPKLLGHKDISMTMRYAHLAENVKKEAVNLLNGLTGKNRDCRKTVTNAQMNDSMKDQKTEITENI